MKAEKRLNAAVLLLGFLAFWANGDTYAAAPLLIRMCSDFSVDIGSAAFTVTAYMLFFGLLTVFFGPLGDRYGRSRILTIAAFSSGALGMVCGFAPNLPSLIAVRALNGAFAAGIMPLAVAHAGDSAAPEARQTRIGQVMGLMFLGGALATVIGGAIAHAGSWRAVYLVYGAAQFLLALPLAFLLQDASAPSRNVRMIASYKAILSIPLIRRTVGLLLFVGLSTLGVFSYLGKFTQDRTGLNVMLVGCLLSAYGAGTFLGGRIAGRIRKALGVRLLPAAGALGAAGLLAFCLADARPAVAVPGLFLYGLGFICLQSSFITTAQDLAAGYRGTVMSLASFTMVVSGALGTLVNGRIIAAAGFPPVLIGAAVAFGSAGALAAALLKEPASGSAGRRSAASR
ncbi:MAG TPA: MFS transporter [Spirochaetia bacterium]|nr:MFS transporter [Spirochaetia bacterium]